MTSGMLAKSLEWALLEGGFLTNSLNSYYAYSIDNKSPSLYRTDELLTQFWENFSKSIFQGIQIFK